MNHPVAYIDAVFVLASAAALLILIGNRRSKILGRASKQLLGWLLIFTLIYSLCLFLEWSGISSAFEKIEDIIGALIPMWWLFIFYGFMQELTNRDLRRSEKKFRAIFDQTFQFIGLLDIKGTLLAANKTSLDVLDIKEEDLLGNPFWETPWWNHSPELQKKLKNAIDRAAKGEFVRFEASHFNKEGNSFYVDFSLKPVHDDTGNVIMLIPEGRDITERIYAQEALQESQERYQGIYNATSDTIFIHDAATGAIIDVNQAMLDMYGYTKEEALKLTVDNFSAGEPPYTQNEADEKINAALLFGLQTFEWKAKRKNGELFWVEVALKFTEFHGKRFIIAAVRDISDRKQVEEELIKIKKLESIGVLAGGIAHDFNNILAAILGNISLANLLLKPDEVKVHSLLQEAEKASLRAKGLTQQLLTFSKGGEPVKSLASISDVIMDSTEFILRGSDVKCEYSFPDDLWHAEIDRGQISQVIQNIILNSRQAMPEGGIITIHCENYVYNGTLTLPIAAGDYIKVSLVDRGVGIPRDLLDKIYDPYFTTKHEGNGLGLAVTHSIIIQHKGHIAADSKQGQGTTVTIYLPAFKQKKLKEQKEEPLPVGGKAKILFMDDDKMVRTMANEMLSHYGYEVFLAQDGQEAITLYRESLKDGAHIDLVIMDLTVPGGMGGKETIKEIIAANPQVKAIVSSGYSNNPIMANYGEYGFSAAVSKPYRQEELIKVINRIIENDPETSK
ncbi:MAG: PAS domain S-box protein [Desulfobacterales bacterium]|nr:PAS domain S-box protein [Desulfobacterales bacterium]